MDQRLTLNGEKTSVYSQIIVCLRANSKYEVSK